MKMPGRTIRRLPVLLAIRMLAGCAVQRPFQDLAAGATALATRIVRESAMSAALGPVGRGSGNPMYLGGEEFSGRPYAEETQRVIDQKVAKLLREAEQRPTTALTDRRDELDVLTQLPLERETVDGTDVDRILGRDPGSNRPVGAGLRPAAGR
jgi:cell division protease FtsH